MKRFYLLYCMVLLLHVGAMAQKNELYASRAVPHKNSSSGLATERAVIGITGKITDETGSSFPGVNVIVKGTAVGTTTDSDGKYSIEVPDAAAILVFSFVGYAVEEVPVGDRTVVDVMLTPDIASLSEVVITALGIKKETRKVGYSAQNVAVEQLIQNRTINVMESLTGKIAGLDISPPAAGVASSTKIRLRGQTAFSGGLNSPLIVINGIPMDQGIQNADGPASQRDRGDALQTLNPDDIESMTVLKGATAAALYGSRAANGAILINTKSGKRGQGIGVEFISNYTHSTALDFTDLQKEYGSGYWSASAVNSEGVAGTGVKPATQGEAVTYGAQNWGARLDGEDVVNFDGKSRPYIAYPSRIKEFYRDGQAYTNTVALSGGNEKGSFRASFSNVSAKGITPNNTYSKKIANLGFNYDISEKLKFSMNTNYSHEQDNNPPQVGAQGSGEANFINRIANSIPLSAYQESVLNPANGLSELVSSGFQNTLINPYFSMPRMFFRDTKERILTTATLRYDLTKWLYIQGRYNYDRSTTFTESNTPSGQGRNSPLNDVGTGYNGSFTLGSTRGTEVNADFLVGAKKEFGDFSVDVSAGGNTYRTFYGTHSQSVTDFITYGLYSLANGLTPGTNSYSIDRKRVNSLYGMAEFGYKNTVYLNLTDRQDWFSVLNPDNNSQNYMSASGSFIFSEVLGAEQAWLSYGKLRAAFAQVGSANGVAFNEGSILYNVLANNYPNGLTDGQKIAGISTTSAPNKELEPFVLTEKEIGLEMKLFNQRLNFDVAVYDKQTKDQVLSIAISNSSGYSTTKKNVGALQNRGLEFSVEIVPVQTTDFKFSTSFNAANNVTKVLKLADGATSFTQTTFGGNGSNEFIGALVYEVGLPLNQLAAKTYQRDANGNILLNGDGTLLATDQRVNFGSGLPTWTGGWNNIFSYKKLSLLVQLDFKAGGKILSSSNLNWTRQGMSKESLVGREGGVVFEGLVANTGEPNTTAVSPSTFYADYRTKEIADPFIYKSDFVKLRNITLSYDFTSLVQSKWEFVKGLTLTAACRNVAILYKDLANLDPEAVSSAGDNRVGYEGTSLPTSRNYSLNLNVRF